MVCAASPVLQAMRLVPRHAFVASALATQAYEDTSLPIGLGQTISKPSVVARMLEWLFLGQQARSAGHLGRVLEIGTGCGYQTALLAQLSRQVVSIERLKGLHDQAASQLRSLGLPNCRLVYGDGMRGHPPNAPYDSIIAAAGGEDLPSAWLDATGGGWPADRSGQGAGRARPCAGGGGPPSGRPAKAGGRSGSVRPFKIRRGMTPDRDTPMNDLSARRGLRWPGLALALAVAVLAGCASPRHQAPVEERSAAGRPGTSRPPVVAPTPTAEPVRAEPGHLHREAGRHADAHLA